MGPRPKLMSAISKKIHDLCDPAKLFTFVLKQESMPSAVPGLLSL